MPFSCRSSRGSRATSCRARSTASWPSGRPFVAAVDPSCEVAVIAREHQLRHRRPAGRSRGAGRGHRGALRRPGRGARDGRERPPRGVALRPPRRRPVVPRSLRQPRARHGAGMIKRLFDASLAGVGLLVSAPFWCVIPLAIKLEDGGPVFFPQARVGLDGRVFQALKFRSMRPDAEALTGPVQATENDPRVTRVGRAAARDGDGRTAAAREHPRRRHELRRPAAAPARRDRGPRRRPADAAVGNPGLRGAPLGPARADGPDAGLRAARHLAHEQVPARSPVPEARRLLPRPEAHRAVVLDHRPRRLGGARPQGLSETARIVSQTL